MEKKNKKIYFLFFILFFLSYNLQAATIIAPLRIEGIGNILAAGYQWKNTDSEFLIGTAIGERNQNILGFNGKKIFPKFDLVGSLFSAKQIQVPSTYTRGSAPAPLFFTTSSIQGFQIGGNFDKKISPSNQLKLSFNFLNTEQNFEDILDEQHQDIPTLESIDLSRFASTVQSFSLGYNYTQLENNNYLQRGWQFYTRMKNSLQTTNTIYSGTLVTDLDSAIYIPWGNIYLVPRAFYSKAQITSQEEEKKEKLKEIFNIQCSSDIEGKQTCRDLERKIVGNLARHNRYGTSSPLGGVNQLRSESVLRYKGSQTQYQAIELRYLISTKKIHMEPVLFWEQGRSFDEKNEGQEKDFVKSNGLEYRIYINEDLVYKLIYAESDRNTAWQLSVASTW